MLNVRYNGVQMCPIHQPYMVNVRQRASDVSNTPTLHGQRTSTYVNVRVYMVYIYIYIYAIGQLLM
jgi:hypothetical protein